MRLWSVVLLGAAWLGAACGSDPNSGTGDTLQGETAAETATAETSAETAVDETQAETSVAETSVAETAVDTTAADTDTSETVIPPYEGFERVWSRLIQATFYTSTAGAIGIRPPQATVLGSRAIGNGTDGVLLVLVSLPVSDVALVDPNALEGAEGAVQPLADLNSDMPRLAVLGLKLADGSLVFTKVLEALPIGTSLGEVGRVPSGFGVTVNTDAGPHALLAQVFGTTLRTATLTAKSAADAPLAVGFPENARVDQGSGGGGFGGGGGPVAPAITPIVLTAEASGAAGDVLTVTPGESESVAFSVTYDGAAAGAGLVLLRLAYASDTAQWPAEGNDALFVGGLEVGAINDATAGPIVAVHATADTTIGGMTFDAGMAGFLQFATADTGELAPAAYWTTDGMVSFDQVQADSFGGFVVVGAASGTVKFGSDTVTAPTGARAFMGRVAADGNGLLFKAEGCDAVQEISVSRSFRMIHTPCAADTNQKSVMIWQVTVDQNGSLTEPVDAIMGTAAVGYEPSVTSPIISLPTTAGRASGAVIDLGEGTVQFAVIDATGVPYDVGAVADLQGDGSPSWIGTVRNASGGGNNSNEILYAVNGWAGYGMANPLVGRAHLAPRLVIE